MDLENYRLLDDNGEEVAIFDGSGHRIKRRKPAPNSDGPPCGVLIDLQNIEALFHARVETSDDDESIDGFRPPPSFTAPRIDVYPLGFLRTAGNIKATGIPRCFYPVLTQINQKLRQENKDYGEDEEDEEDSGDDSHFSGLSPDPIVVPVSSQFYNYITHRTASRSGSHESQQGSVTSALAGAFAQSARDKRVAASKQRYCDNEMPSDRFHRSITLEDCPKSGRAELVYAVDLRRIKYPSGA